MVSNPSSVRDFRHVQHAAAEKSDLAAVLGGEIQNLLQAVNGAAEAGDDQAPLAAREELFEARTDSALALGVAGPIDVGGIRQQQQHAALAIVGERVQIEQLVIGWRRIDLEIAGVNDHAKRRGDGQRHRS